MKARTRPGCCGDFPLVMWDWCCAAAVGIISPPEFAVTPQLITLRSRYGFNGPAGQIKARIRRTVSPADRWSMGACRGNGCAGAAMAASAAGYRRVGNPSPGRATLRVSRWVVSGAGDRLAHAGLRSSLQRSFLVLLDQALGRPLERPLA